MKRRLAIPLLASLAIPCAAQDRAVPEPSSIERAIADLGDADWRTREQATARLVEMPAAIRPWLEAAEEGPDPEVAWRGSFVREAHERRFADIRNYLRRSSRRTRCAFDRGVRAPRFTSFPDEVLAAARDLLASEVDDLALVEILRLCESLFLRGHLRATPPEALEIAARGPREARVAALELAARIGDPAGIDAIVATLEDLPSSLDPEDFIWSWRVLQAAGRAKFEFKRTATPRRTRSMTEAIASLRLESLAVVHAGAETFPLGEGVHAVALPRILEDLRPLGS